MTTSTKGARNRPASKTRPRGAPRPPTREDLEANYPGLVEHLEATRPDFVAELGRLRSPRWRAPVPSARARAAGVHFDLEEVDRFLRFCRKLRHIKGRRFAGRPFVPDLWQVVFVIAPLFGWRRADGTRLYRTIYLEVPRKNGKSTLCAAIALYLLTADREPGAEVYCLDPATPVLTADLSWKPVGELAAGDELVGFDEDPVESRYRKLRSSKVLNVWRTTGRARRLTFEDGSSVVCSDAHRWLARAPRTLKWRRADELRVGWSLRHLVDPWETEETRDAGYLAGVFDGEGYLHAPGGDRSGFRVGFAQCPGGVLDETVRLVDERGFARSEPRPMSVSSAWQFEIRGLPSVLRFLGQIRPGRLLERHRLLWEGKSPARSGGFRRIVAIDDLGERELVDIETSTGTFLAAGYFSHNSAAKDRDQARAVFDVARRMARASPALRRRLEIPKGATAKTIRYDATASFYTALSSDTGGAAKHGLNVHGVIIDELHVITDRELVTTLETGTGSRDQPLVAYITTAGIPGESPVWEDKRDQAVKVADGTVELEDFLTIIYAADPKVAIDGSWADPEVWADANPGLGISLRPDYIASKASEAAITPANLNAFLRLHLNVPSDALAGWLPLPTWDRSASIVDEADLHGARCFGGLDLASSLDLAALVLVFPDESDRIIDVVARFWTPEATLAKRAHRDRADYELWAREGWLTATPGETIDYDVIEADVGNLLAGLGSGCEAIDYDPWGSKQLRQHLEQAGAKIFELRQGFASISPPMKEAERLVVERNLRHGGNPVLRWMVANTVTVQDPAGNIKPDRKRSRSRIDGVVALIMAISAWQRSISRGRSVYDERGLEVVG